MQECSERRISTYHYPIQPYTCRAVGALLPVFPLSVQGGRLGAWPTLALDKVWTAAELGIKRLLAGNVLSKTLGTTQVNGSCHWHRFTCDNTSLLLPANKERSQSELTRASESRTHDSNRKTKSSCTATLKTASKIWLHSICSQCRWTVPLISTCHFAPAQTLWVFIFFFKPWKLDKPKEEKITHLVSQQHSDKGSNWQQSPWDCPALIKPNYFWWPQN